MATISNTVPDWMDVAATQEPSMAEVFPSYHFYTDDPARKTTIHFDQEEHEYFRLDDNGLKVVIPGVTTVLKVAIDKSYALIPWATKLCVEKIRAGLINADGSFKQLSTEEFALLLEEGKNQHRVKLDEAGNIGTMAHNALEMIAKRAIEQTGGYVKSARGIPDLPQGYVKGSDLTLEMRTSMARQCVLAALDWVRRHNVRFIHTERKIYSRSHEFAGTTDGVVEVDSCDDLACCRGQHFKRQLAVLDFKSSSGLRDEYAWQVAAYQFALIEELNLPITHRYVLRLGKEDGKFEPWLLDPSFFEADLQTFLNALNLYHSLDEIRTRRSEDKKALKALIKAEADKAKQAKAEAERAEKEARKAEREEAKLAKLAEADAKRAIRKAEKAEREAAKPGKPVLVQPKIPVLGAEPSQPSEAKATPMTGGRTGTANVPTGATPSIDDDDFWKDGFSIGADGKERPIAAPAKPSRVEVIQETAQDLHDAGLIDDQTKQEFDGLAEPGIAQTVQASAERRAVARFWSLGSTYITDWRVM